MEEVEVLVENPEEARRAVEEAARNRVKRLVLRVKALDAASAAEIVREALRDTLPFTVIAEVAG